MRRSIYCVLLAVFILLPWKAHASAGVTYHGRLIAPSGQPVVSSVVTFKIQIRSPGSENCLLFEENQTKDLSQTGGVFTLNINEDPGMRTDTTGLSFDRIFSNQGTFALTGNCSIGNTYSPTYADNRKIQVYFNDGSFVGWEPMPSQNVNYVPKALDALQVGGFQANHLLRVEDGGVPQSVSSMTSAQFAEMMKLILGTSTQYLKTSSTGASLPSFSSDPSGASAGQMWYDSSGNVIKFYNGSTVQTLGVSGSGISSLTAGTGLTGGTITTSGTIALATAGTAGTYYQVTTDAYGRVTSGQSSLVEADIPSLSTAGKVSGSAITSGTIGGSTAISTTGSIVTTNDITSKRNILYDHSGAGPGFVGMQAPADMSGVNYTLTFPATAGTAGQVLSTTNTSGTLAWTNLVATDLSTITGTGIVQRNGANSYSTVNVLSPLSYTGGNLGVNAGSGGVLLDGGNTVTGTLSAGTISNHNVDIKTANTVRMTIDNSGKVGIGTTSPAQALDVNGNAVIRNQLVARDDATFGYLGGTTGGTYIAKPSVYGKPAVQSVDSAFSADSLLLNPAGGLVGVGITPRTSTSALQTNGDISLGHTGAQSLGFNTYYDNTWRAYQAGFSGAIRFDAATGQIQFANSSGSVAANAATSMSFPMVINASGHVAVGTMNPTSKFEVFQGDINSSLLGTETASSAYFTLQTKGAGTLFGTPSSTKGWRILGRSDAVTPANEQNDLGFAYYDGTSFIYPLWIDSVTGNIGMGTSTPSAKLEVNGVVKATSFEGTMVSSGTSNASGYTINSDTDSAGGDGGVNLQVRGSTKLAVTDGGRVSIGGATTPASLLANTNTNTTDVAGTGSSVDSLTWLTNAAGYVATFTNTSSATNANGVFVKTTGTAGTNRILNLNSNGTDVMTVTGQGNVGIGTTSPKSGLHLHSSGSIFTLSNSNSANSTILTMYTQLSDVNEGVGAGNPSGNNRGWNIQAQGNTAGAGPNNLQTQFWNGSGWIQPLTLTSSGSVGIGTTTPRGKLNVYGTGQTTTSIDTNGDLNNMLVLQSSNISPGDGGGILFGTRTVGGATDGLWAAIKSVAVSGNNNSAGDLAISTRTVNTDATLTEKMRIMASGRVGIGKSNPAQKLDVLGSARLVGVDFQDSSGVQFPDAWIGAANNVEPGLNKWFHVGGITDNTDGTGAKRRIVLAADTTHFTGNVGIGTTNPLRTFHVESNTNSTTGARISNSSSGAAAHASLDLMSDAGSAWLGIGSSNSSYPNALTIATTTTGPIRIATSNAERIRIDAVGNVGIGTTNPLEALDIGGVDSSIALKTNSAIMGNLYFDTGWKYRDNGVAGYLKFNPVTDNGGSFEIGMAAATNALGAGAVAVPVAALNVMPSGNVGIGTTNPTEKLDVDGNLKVRAGTAFSSLMDNGIDTPAVDVIRFSSAATEMRLQNKGGAGNGFMSFWNEGSERVRINNVGNVGIGTTNPLMKLHVNGNVRVGGPDFSLGTDDGRNQGVNLYQRALVHLDTTASAAPYDDMLYVNFSGDFEGGTYIQGPRTLIDGSVGIGTTNPGYKLDVQGGGVNASGGYTQTSDIRLKTKVEYLNSKEALDRITNLHGIYYDWKDQAQFGRDHQVGLVAQDVQKVFPEAVKVNSEGFLSVSYSNLVAPVIEAIKELLKISDQHSRQIASIKAESAAKDLEIAQLKADAEKQKQENATIKTYLCAKDPQATICK